MVDTLTAEQRSRQMARVRAQNTAPELAVRRGLHARGLRFRLHRRDLPGCPDIVLPRHRVALFVHGCFWHGCFHCDRGRRRPMSNRAFWDAKLDENVARDARNGHALRELGWRVIVVWECETRDRARLDTTLDRIAASVSSEVSHG
jgi:DNA mismatch endonuclease, patch repair protein